MVLAGGPDKERPVSLNSGQCVTAALREAGHEVVQRDITPGDTGCLDEFLRWGGDVVFPVLHGPWGEGGGLQKLLDARGLRYVGSAASAAALCMDKQRTKLLLAGRGLPTPASELISPTATPRLAPPLVVKPNDEGSSIDLTICRSASQVAAALAGMVGRYQRVLVEQFVAGREMTVGVIGTGRDAFALPPIRIVPAVEYYDYQAKYTREDTQYLLDPEAIGLDAATLDRLKAISVEAHRLAGCRHLSRVDLIVDDAGQPWVLEINTLPGFTTHSLLPKAAAYAGITLPALVDRLVRLALTPATEQDDREAQQRCA